MTCAKTIVTAVLTCADGQRFTGTNYCQNPQATCPREPGEGYEKCGTICQQPYHAEVCAIVEACKADADWRKGHMRVSGVGHVCKECMSLMESFEITWELA
jgi:hypothetical protein